MTPDFRRRASVPIRDMHDGGRIVFLVDVYGVDWQDLATVGAGIGSRPLVKAVRRLGLDPDRYQATLFDLGEDRASLYDPRRGFTFVHE